MERGKALLSVTGSEAAIHVVAADYRNGDADGRQAHPRANDRGFHTPGNHPFNLQLRHEMPRLQYHAIHLTKDWHRAQDLMQETLTKAWASRDRYAPDTNLRAWLHTILRNTFLSDIRKRWREVEDEDGTLAAQLAQLPSQEHAVALSELLAAMTALPRQQREALTLVGVAGFSQEEAADRLDCALGTVKSRVWRARATLSVLMLSK
ncbi:MAG: sigma-70 family RNA polymerase sigma factor [Oceanibaculum nanhaiense]|jgi:RNA polymerase sigma-70 factor (ECF subfamily)|uniref:sigma-70 family RNA polymerase sigma factor n=1 Tax=Oceanibaculum nanhaiense TaxID=1909734 RepID=UPI0032EC5ABC